jgi:hypothetical protein
VPNSVALDCEEEDPEEDESSSGFCSKEGIERWHALQTASATSGETSQMSMTCLQFQGIIPQCAALLL